MKSRILILSLAIFAFSAFKAHAQVDATINPINLLFGTITVGADVVLTDEFSVEATLGYTSRKDDVLAADAKYTGIPIQLIGKYYFNPDRGADKFYADVFLRYVNRSYKYDDDSANFSDFNQSRIGAGIGFGYKTVSRSNIVFDFGLNVGRVIADNTKYADSSGTQEEFSLPGLIIGVKLGVGYRFGS